MMVQANSDLLGSQQQSVQATNNFANTVRSIFISSGSSGIGVHAFNNITTTATTVLSANSSRGSITFSNPGGPDIFVWPTLDANGATITVSTGSLGGSFRIFGNGGTLTVTGAIQTAWQAISSSGTGNLTVLESNTR
jgi:hypothetical protein